MSNSGDPLPEVFQSFDPKDQYYLFDDNTQPSEAGSDAIHQQSTTISSTSFHDSSNLLGTDTTAAAFQSGPGSLDPPQLAYLTPNDIAFSTFDDPQSFLNPFDMQIHSSAYLSPGQQPRHYRSNSHSSDTSAPSPQQFHSPYAASPMNPDEYALEMAGLPELTHGLDLNVVNSPQPETVQMDMAVSPMTMGIPEPVHHQSHLNPPLNQTNYSTGHSSLQDIGNVLSQTPVILTSSHGPALSPSLLSPNMLSPNSSHQSYSSSPQTPQGSISSSSHQSIPLLSVEPPQEDHLHIRSRSHSNASHYSERSTTPCEGVPTLFPHTIPSPSQLQDPADLLSPSDAAGIQSGRSRSRSSSISDARSHSRSRSPSSGGNRSRSNSHSRDYILELAAPTSTNKRVQKHPSTFACHLCDKRFTRSYNLRSHLRTHTDERPFVCTVCGKAFARQHDRKRHEALHSGEKKYQCQGVLADGVTPWGCGRKFARADALGRHFKTEAGRECIRLLLEEEANEKQILSASGGPDNYPVDGVPSLTFSPPGEPQNEPLPQPLQPVIFPAALLQKYPVLLNHLNED